MINPLVSIGGNPLNSIKLPTQNSPTRPSFSFSKLIHFSRHPNTRNSFKHKTMIYPLVSIGGNPLNPIKLAKPIQFSHHPNTRNTINNPSGPTKAHIKKPIRINQNEVLSDNNTKKKKVYDDDDDERRGSSQIGIQKMLVLCGFGYWVQGFRGFPWLALNFHMAHNLNFHPSTLQLVQNIGNLPMVIKPLYGILSDALYIAGAHRIPYICIGVLLQVLSWGSLALIPIAGEALPTIMACVLLSNLGASITEVAKDALVAEYGYNHKMSGLQSYAFMALAAGGILGNLLGGFFLLKTQEPKWMFFVFTCLLSLQFSLSLATREISLGLPQPSTDNSLVKKRSVTDNIRKQYSDLMTAISEESISRPLTWIVASIAMVPILSGSIFCYQTQCLNLDPSLIGMSKVTSQLMLLSITVIYDSFWKSISMRKLIGIVQILYASSLLLDLVLVTQINLKLGIPNGVFALCFSGVSETIAQFKLLPFQVLFASLAPQGCEGSLTSFLASALCLASIVSGFSGVGLASLLGISSGDFSSLPLGILIQFLAALVPVIWIFHVPSSQSIELNEKKTGRSKRTRRNRRVGRVVFGSVYAYRRERESEV